MRAFFFAVGLCLMFLGGEALLLDKAVLNVQQMRRVGSPPPIRNMISVNTEQKMVIDPPMWIGYALLSSGAVTVLYSIALPKKKG